MGENPNEFVGCPNEKPLNLGLYGSMGVKYWYWKLRDAENFWGTEEFSNSCKNNGVQKREEVATVFV